MTESLKRVQRRLIVRGHIHPAYGSYRLGDTEVVNASLVDDHTDASTRFVQIKMRARRARR